MLKPEFFSTVKSGDYSRAPRALGSSPPLRSVELPKASKSLSNVYTMSLHYLLPMLLLTWNPPLRRMAKRRGGAMPFAANGIAPPLPLSKASALPNLPKTFFSLCRQAKLHAEGASLSACGKHHSPKANFTVQPAAGRGCTTGDREAVEGAGGYESNDLPFMRCFPLFSSVGTEMSSLLCAFSFSRSATAPSRREPFR